MIGTSELILIFLVALLLFGGKRLPELARSLGQALNEFKNATSVNEKKEENPSEISRDPKES